MEQVKEDEDVGGSRSRDGPELLVWGFELRECQSFLFGAGKRVLAQSVASALLCRFHALSSTLSRMEGLMKLYPLIVY
ncbi:hypothetical protein BT69DRAFT_1291365 [Atractiella rhizophila]|nr:hypothetical protein BT69DRAFT_1291365 [Atractiella rhizophila]